MTRMVPSEISSYLRSKHLHPELIVELMLRRPEISTASFLRGHLVKAGYLLSFVLLVSLTTVPQFL